LTAYRASDKLEVDLRYILRRKIIKINLRLSPKKWIAPFKIFKNFLTPHLIQVKIANSQSSSKRAYFDVDGFVNHYLPQWMINGISWFKPYFRTHFLVMTLGVVVLLISIGNRPEKFEFIPDVSTSPEEISSLVALFNGATALAYETPNEVTAILNGEEEDMLEVPTNIETNITQEPKAEVQIEKRSKLVNYTVEGGDTLSSIAKRYGLKVATIKYENKLESVDRLKLGQVLRIPTADYSDSFLTKMAAKDTGSKKVVLGSRTVTSRDTAGGYGGNFAGTLQSPVDGWHQSQGFGRRHTGIDLDWRSGTTIHAAGSGRVILVSRGWGGGYGNHIIIDHGNGITTLYGHLSAFKVSAGEYVEAGQVIGIMGSTGWSTGTHLHFEVRRNGVPTNPMNYF
jgi:LysM repeat protein